MIILNLGCGGIRLPEPFFNVDDLHAHLMPGTPERKNLDDEPNYFNCDMRRGFSAGVPRDVDGILLAHVVEHLDLQESLVLLWRCRELLKPGGVIRVSVPDPHYFKRIRETGDGPDFVRANFCPGYGDQVGWTETALFFTQHKQCIDGDILRLQLSAAGFEWHRIQQVHFQVSQSAGLAAMKLADADNRDKLSVFVEAVRTEQEPTEGQVNHHRYRVAELARRPV